LEALAQYEAIAAADAEDPVPWRAAAELLARRGDTAKAAEAWREVLRLAPNDAGARDGLAQLADVGPSYGTSAPLALTAATDHVDHASHDIAPPAAPPPSMVVPPRGPLEWGFDAQLRPAVPPR
jgi:hypothetical protein